MTTTTVPERGRMTELALYFLRLGFLGFGGPVALFRWKVSNPALIAATAVIGLIAYPLLQPAWVMVK